MLSLFRKHKNNSILKLFRVVTADEARQFDAKYFINTVLELLENSFGDLPSDYYITGPYPDRGWKTSKGFLNGLEVKNFKDVCHLILSTEAYSFSFTNWSINEIQPKEIDNQTIIFNIREEIADLEKLVNFAFNMHKAFPFQYGYLLTLPDNYFSFTEQKKSKSSVTKEYHAWTKSINQIANGLIKDVYPINFIQEQLVKNPVFNEKVVALTLGDITKTEIGLYKWALSTQDTEKAKQILRETKGILIDLDT
jgi:hypothetical protein